MGIESVLTGGLAKAVGVALDELITSDQERGEIDVDKIKARAERLKVQLLPVLAELEIQKKQAEHPSIFVAGARPSLIWVGSIGLAFGAIAIPLLNWAGQMQMGDAWTPIPPLDVVAILGAVGAGLGGSVIRSIDKKNGTARDNLKRPTPRPSGMAPVFSLGD